MRLYHSFCGNVSNHSSFHWIYCVIHWTVTVLLYAVAIALMTSITITTVYSCQIEVWIRLHFSIVRTFCALVRSVLKIHTKFFQISESIFSKYYLRCLVISLLKYKRLFSYLTMMHVPIICCVSTKQIPRSIFRTLYTSIPGARYFIENGRQ